MVRLLAITESLISQHDSQANMLMQAHNITNDILDTLESTAISATGIQKSLLRDYGAGSWWPFIVCPTATLVMGSYGLSPSAFRNLGLVALGEVLGLAISSYHRLDWDVVHSIWAAEKTNPEMVNSAANLTIVAS